MSLTTNRNIDTATILDTAATSSEVYVGDYCRGSIATDAALDGIAFTWQVSNDGSQWDTVRNDDGTADSAVTVAASKNYKIPKDVFSYQYARILSGTSQSGADSVITFFLAQGAAS
jgi:hypothetical protein